VTNGELAVLARAHQLFAGATRPPPGLATAAAGHDARGLSAARTDAAAARVIDAAHGDRARARDLTSGVLDEARADTATPATPMAQREAIRRRAARLRAQRAHVVAARAGARRQAAALRALRYRLTHHRGSALIGRRLPPNARAALAVRAALSRLGRPYVWGATGPTAFDCSGLVQWSYAQAGVHLDRTTYQQIHDGIPVPRSQVRPGDLVFPHAGHVQLAIGNNLVVEAPHAGASVRISHLGSNVQIRRPL